MELCCSMSLRHKVEIVEVFYPYKMNFKNQLSRLCQNITSNFAKIGYFLTSTRYPTTTGTSVLGVKFDGGVLMAADTLG